MTLEPPTAAPRGPILLCAGTDPGLSDRLGEAATRLLADRPVLVVETRHAGAPCRRPPWQFIVELADEVDAAVIVADSSEDALAHRVDRPLLLVPGAGGDGPALLAYDGSSSAADAIGAAAALLLPRPALVASVWHGASAVVGAAMLAIPDEVAREGAARLDESARLRAAGEAGQAAAILGAAGWDCEPLALETPRSVARAIVDAADECDAALIVAGTRGRSRIAAALLGSTAEGILRGAGRPVLLVPGASS
jgi:nucleotide-binding universal stress UspA family protein